VFSNKGLKERHWQQISDVLNFPVRLENKDKLAKFIMMELSPEIYVRLEEISDSASKEFGIEKILDKMREDWMPIEVELKEWKDTKTCVVAGGSVDEVQ